MRLAISTALVCALLAFAAISQDYDKVEITATPVAGQVTMLQGAGGNIGVFAGADGVFVIDDQYAPLSAKIKAAIAKLSKQPVRFLVNTHWHGDHTGGNEAFGSSGTLIVAHENVRKRLASEQFIEAFGSKVPPSPAAALPVITYAEGLSFHLNGEDVRVFHVAHAHTDGDSMIHFSGSKVLHMGDAFFNGLYPFIDLSSGGSIDGMIAASETALALVDADTRIIPGHGPLADRAALQAYHDMLKTVRDRVAAGIEAGKTLEQVQAMQPSKAWDAQWGGAFIKPAQFIGFVYDSLQSPPTQ